MKTLRAHLHAAAVAAIVALSACASSGGLHPVGFPLDPMTLTTGRSLTAVTVSPAEWPKADWWIFLGDTQLNALIGEALHDNPKLAEADARARQAQAETAAADASRAPDVNAGGRVAEARIPTTLPPLGNGHNKAAKYIETGFAWDLDIWGGERAAWEAALGRQRAVEIDAEAARIEVSGNVARAFIQLGYAYAQQDVAVAELQRATDVRTLTQQRVVAGIDNLIQVKQSESEVASAQGQSAQAERAIHTAQIALAILLGQGPDRGWSILRPQLVPPNVLGVPPNLPVELLGHRADLVAARWRVEAAERSIREAKTEFLPNVNISAMAGLIALGGGNLFQAKSRFYDATPAISLPIFDGGRRRANLNGKDADYDIAVAKYNIILIRAVNEVADDHDALESLQVQVAAQQRAVDAANDAWSLAEARFKGGIGSYLEALSARQELLLAEERMAALRAQQCDFLVQMIRALGGGFYPNQVAHNLAAFAPDAAYQSP